MNTDNDFYQNTDYKYTEIGIAKTNFIYGGRVDIYIPTITPFKSGKKDVLVRPFYSTVSSLL